MKHVYTARDGLDANFLRGLLEGEGIRAVVQGEALQEAWGSLNLTQASLPSVWVDDGDAGKANGIVEEYRRRDAAQAEEKQAAGHATWVCQNCHTRVEEQFTKCWRCGHDRKPGPDGAALA